jgi:uncharacterized C2H2 Zn-finger protein
MTTGAEIHWRRDGAAFVRCLPCGEYLTERSDHLTWAEAEIVRDAHNSEHHGAR